MSLELFIKGIGDWTAVCSRMDISSSSLLLPNDSYNNNSVENSYEALHFEARFA